MRQINPSLAAHLASGSTTLCHCWKVLRRDGAIVAFTDHDSDVSFSGKVFLARTGADATKLEASLGFSVGGMEVSGALNAEAISGDDLTNGKYDDATVETWLVNWADTSQSLLLDIGTIGQVKRSEFGFVAELRGLAHQFDQETGRLFQKACSADLGDGKCRVSLNSAQWTINGIISKTDGATRFDVALGGFAGDWFTGGKLTFTSGANSGATRAIKSDSATAATHTLEIWTPMAAPLSVGDAFTLVAGCDKSFATCRSKFANSVNFRGFPHMPGNDVVMRYVTQKDPALDGGSMNK